MVKRYVQLHNTGPEIDGQPFFHPATSRVDGVTVMAFASMKNVETFLLSDSHAEIEEAERAISVAEAGEYWTDATLTIVDQLVPEKETTR